MRCPNCRCEIGTLEVCPYCGIRLRNPARAPRAGAARPMPAVYRAEHGNSRANRHVSNIDTWSLTCAILLGGIFIMEVLQVVLAVMG